MSFFKSISNNNNNRKNKNTTANFFIGSPEAEGETIASSKMYIGEIFGDYLNVFPELSSEKFIVTGRKGAGKSAIAEYIHFKAKDSPNTFCDYLKIKDIELNKLVQLGTSIGEEITEKSLFEWMILTKLVRLLTEDESIAGNKEIKDLKTFLNRNSGIVNINSYEISEISRNKSIDVNVELFKRAFNALFKRSILTKEHKAPFYKLIDPLKQVIIKLFRERVTNENEFFIMFDDLDIGFKADKNESILFITNILRSAKDFNIDFFGKNEIKAKVIIFLRDDIKRVIVNNNADTAKIFSSYEIPLIWYEHENFKNNENSVALKRMINKRLSINFEREQIQYDKDNPWSTFINDKYESSSFKEILDYTFFRPRDLILFFKPLPNKAFTLPLMSSDIKILIELFVGEFVYEIRNELSAIFSTAQINTLFTCLKELKFYQPLKYEDIITKLEEVNFDYNHEQTLSYLFEYCLIGNIDKSDINFVKIYFKHREQYTRPCELNTDLHFIYHKAIEAYFDINKL